MFPQGSGQPPKIANLASSCSATTGASEVAFNVNKSIAGVSCSVVITNSATLAVLFSDEIDIYTNAKAFTVAGLPNADYTITADNTEATATASFTVNCIAASLSLISLDTVQPTATMPTGAVQILVTGGAPGYTCTIPGLVTNAALTQQPVGWLFYRELIDPGVYTATITDSAANAQSLVVGFEIIAARGGCRDPEADNYDPLATYENGSCSFSPRVELATAIQPLVPNGRPVLIELSSAELPGAVPAKADAFINLVGLGGALDIEIVVNGYRFTSGPLLLPTNYTDAPSLVEALNAVQALAADYLIKLNQDDELRITARETGTPHNITITTNAPNLVSIVSLPGVNRYRSQSRSRFAVWLEVWTGAPDSNPSTFSDIYEDAYRDRYGRLISSSSVGAAPVLAQRFEMEYRADNRYIFDIAAALRQFTGHAYPTADGSCPDRLCSYFLKYGELYATTGPTRRQRTAYASAVGWAIDAVELVAPFAANCYLLTRRPAPWRSFRASASPSLLLGNQPGPALYDSQLTRSRFDGISATQAGPVVAQGRVTRLTLPGAFFDGQLSGSLEINTPGAGFIEVAQLDLLLADGPAVTFANGQGGFDTVIFEGAREEITKRSAAVYATTTGSALRSAQLPEAFRLNSGLLTRAEWLWLRRELGNSPAAWLESSDGPQPIALTAFAAEADELLGLYTITIDCDPQRAEIIGLTN